jgi:hypothetical protein
VFANASESAESWGDSMGLTTRPQMGGDPVCLNCPLFTRKRIWLSVIFNIILGGMDRTTFAVACGRA